MRSNAGSIVKAGSLRTTLHVMSAAEFPYLASAYVESERGRTEGLGVDVEVLRAALPDEPITSAELFELGHRVLGTDDRWTVAFAYRALPFVRTAPVGSWPHTKPSPFVTLAGAAAGASGERDPRRAAVPRRVRPGNARRHRPVHLVQGSARSIRRSRDCRRSPTRRGGRSSTFPVHRARPAMCPLRFASCRPSTRSSSRIATVRGSSRPSTSTRCSTSATRRRRTRSPSTGSSPERGGSNAGGWWSSRSRRCRRACAAKWTPRATGCSPGTLG